MKKSEKKDFPDDRISKYITAFVGEADAFFYSRGFQRRGKIHRMKFYTWVRTYDWKVETIQVFRKGEKDSSLNMIFSVILGGSKRILKDAAANEKMVLAQAPVRSIAGPEAIESLRYPASVMFKNKFAEKARSALPELMLWFEHYKTPEKCTALIKEARSEKGKEDLFEKELKYLKKIQNA